MKKGVRKILIGGSVAVAGIGAAAAASYRLVKKLVGVAMDRKEPVVVQKNRKKFSGSSYATDWLARMEAAGEALKNSGTERVEITSSDGLRLVGHWYAPKHPRRAIVAMHGWRSSWTKDFGIISDFWKEQDCAVLYAEQRGQGESEGDYMTFGLLERYDCFAWINWVNEKTGGSLPIYLGGVSMGATTVLMAVGLDLPASVKGVVADCGFTSPHAIWKHVVSNNLHISYNGIAASFADKVSREKINMTSKEYSTVDALRACRVPVLLIHGTEDRFVPVEMTYENYQACAAEKRLLIVPGAGHGMSYIVDEPAYRAAVVQFWKDFDDSTRAAAPEQGSAAEEQAEG